MRTWAPEALREWRRLRSPAVELKGLVLAPSPSCGEGPSGQLGVLGLWHPRVGVWGPSWVWPEDLVSV
eukprot:15475800-Alexandrium_andersonii.AAC.1